MNVRTVFESVPAKLVEIVTVSVSVSVGERVSVAAVPTWTPAGPVNS